MKALGAAAILTFALLGGAAWGQDINVLQEILERLERIEGRLNALESRISSDSSIRRAPSHMSAPLLTSAPPEIVVDAADKTVPGEHKYNIGVQNHNISLKQSTFSSGDKKNFDGSLVDSILLNQGCPASGERLDRKFYIVCFDEEKRIPLWVGYRLNANLLKGDTPRTNDFRQDPDIPKENQALPEDYVGSRYDRGQMAPAAAFKRSREAMSTTFLMTNMAPQTPHLNRGVWALIEEQVRTVVLKEGGEVLVFTGNLNIDGQGKQVSPKNFIGKDDNVAVPSHSYKIILHVPGENKPEAIYALAVPNWHGGLVRNSAEYAVSVDDIERWSGIDFFADLEDNIEKALESKAVPVSAVVKK